MGAAAPGLRGCLWVIPPGHPPAPPGGMKNSLENPLSGGERRLQPSGVGSARPEQPTPTPLHRRGTRAGRPCHVAWASCPCKCPISRPLHRKGIIFILGGGTWRHDNSPENASGFAISANNQMNWGQLSLEAPEPKSPSSLDRYSSSGALVSAAQDRSVRIHSRT